MIQLYTDTGQHVGALAAKKTHVKHALACDEKTLRFSYPVTGPHFEALKVEAYVRTKSDEFVIKEITAATNSGWVDVTAAMNIEGIENCTFAGGFEAVEKTMPEVLAQALTGSDWSVGTCQITKRRTIRKEDDCNAWDVLEQCVSTFRAEVELNTLERVINIYTARGEDRGVFFMEGVNLQRLEYNRDSYDFFTEIVPIGKDGLTLMADPDDPVLVLTNYQYSRKRVRRIWRDERYTHVETLREDALAKLAEACQPMTSYNAAVKDLAKANPERREFFAYGVGDVITLISKDRKIRERQRVVAVDEYEDSTDNTVELNTASKSFALIQKSEAEAAAATAQRLANGYTDDSLDGYATNDEVEQIVQSAVDVDLSTLATKNELTNATTAAFNAAQDAQDAAEAAAQEMARQAEAAAVKSFQDALKAYYTAEQTDDAIAEAVTGSESTAGGTFAKKTDVEELAAQIGALVETTAEDLTEDLTQAETRQRGQMATKEETQQVRAAAELALAAAQEAGTKETGRAETDATGAAVINLSAAFAAAAAGGYRVWLQPRGAGALYVSDSDTDTFTVTGEASLTFDWIAMKA